MRKQWGKWCHFNIPRSEVAFRKKIKIDEKTGCWNWTGARHSSGEYGSVSFAGHCNQLAHRVSWKIFRRQDPGKSFVCHKCDNRLCVNPDHLFLGTQTDNMRDMERKGRSRHPRCEEHGRAKLTMKEVEKIRALYDGGMAIRAIAREFTKVNRTSIAHIVHRRTWITT
jgi:hypothetical protein